MFKFVQILLFFNSIFSAQVNNQEKKLSDSHSHNFMLEAQEFFRKTDKEEYEFLEIVQLFLKLYGETNMDNIRSTLKKINLNHDISDSEKHDLFLAETIEDFLKEVQIDENKIMIKRSTVMDLIKDNSFFHYLEIREESEAKPDLELLKQMVEEDEKYDELFKEFEDEENSELQIINKQNIQFF